jgi:hypothetical protein
MAGIAKFDPIIALVPSAKSCLDFLEGRCAFQFLQEGLSPVGRSRVQDSRIDSISIFFRRLFQMKPVSDVVPGRCDTRSLGRAPTRLSSGKLSANSSCPMMPHAWRRSRTWRCSNFCKAAIRPRPMPRSGTVMRDGRDFPATIPYFNRQRRDGITLP